MPNEKENRFEFFGGYLAGIIMGFLIGFTIAVFLAKYIWVNEATYYNEVHYKYTHCPFCGELLERE